MHAEIPPGAFTFWRWAVAAAVLVPFAATDAWSRRRLLARNWLLIAMLAASGVVAFQYFVYRGLQTTTAINGVLIMSTIPVAIPIIALLLDGSRISRRQALGIAVSLTGVVTIILRGDLRVAAGLQFAPGDFWIFLSVPAWAFYSVIVKRAPADPPPLALLFATVLFGLAILVPGYALESRRVVASPPPRPPWPASPTSACSLRSSPLPAGTLAWPESERREPGCSSI